MLAIEPGKRNLVLHKRNRTKIRRRRVRCILDFA